MTVSTLHHPRLNLVRHLVARDLKARYKVSVLGFFWSLLKPLFMIAIFTVVFDRFLRFGISYEGLHYSVFLLCGILPWTFFAEGVVESTNCMIANANLIRKVYIPRYAFPVSSVLSKLVNFLLALLVLLPVVFIFGGVKPTWYLVFFPAIVMVQLLLILGLGFFLSLGNVYFRDLTILVDVIVMAWFYLTPVFYPLRLAWDKLGAYPLLRFLYMANPMNSIIYCYRRVLLHSVPQSAEYPLPITDLQAAKYFVIGAIISGLIFVGGFLLFRRHQQFLEDYL